MSDIDAILIGFAFIMPAIIFIVLAHLILPEDDAQDYWKHRR